MDRGACWAMVHMAARSVMSEHACTPGPLQDEDMLGSASLYSTDQKQKLKTRLQQTLFP